jgi:hypothetical protein
MSYVLHISALRDLNVNKKHLSLEYMLKIIVPLIISLEDKSNSVANSPYLVFFYCGAFFRSKFGCIHFLI